MSLKKRTTAPERGNKYYKHTSAGGLNECILIKGGEAIPNCVGYAWGRAYEMTGKRPKLSKSNAENWWGNTGDGYKRGQTPKVGAVICWSKGKAGVSSDGAGHVAIVEDVYSDGSILTSNSAYGGVRFYCQRLDKGYKLNGYKFQGFIYVTGDNKSGSSNKSSGNTTTYKAGKEYTLRTDVNVRAGAGTNYRIKRVSELTSDGKNKLLRVRT